MAASGLQRLESCPLGREGRPSLSLKAAGWAIDVELIEEKIKAPAVCMCLLVVCTHPVPQSFLASGGRPKGIAAALLFSTGRTSR